MGLEQSQRDEDIDLARTAGGLLLSSALMVSLGYAMSIAYDNAPPPEGASDFSQFYYEWVTSPLAELPGPLLYFAPLGLGFGAFVLMIGGIVCSGSIHMLFSRKDPPLGPGWHLTRAGWRKVE